MVYQAPPDRLHRSSLRLREHHLLRCIRVVATYRWRPPLAYQVLSAQCLVLGSCPLLLLREACRTRIRELVMIMVRISCDRGSKHTDSSSCSVRRACTPASHGLSAHGSTGSCCGACRSQGC